MRLDASELRKDAAVNRATRLARQNSNTIHPVNSPELPTLMALIFSTIYANGTLLATTDERHPTATDPDQATTYVYDRTTNGCVLLHTPKRSGNDSLPRTTTYYYDQNGVGDDYTRTANVPTKVVSPGGKIVKTTYDKNLRTLTVTAVGVAPAVDAVTTYTYDNNGTVVKSEDPNNNITTYQYDALDR